MEKVVSIILLFLLSSNVCSESFNDNLNILNNLDDEESRLYLEDLDQKKNIKSITYLVDSDIIDKEKIKLFKYFSEIIGEKHGAIYLSTDDKNYKELRKIYTNANAFVALDFMSDSSCKFFKKDNGYLVFESILDKKCFYFDIIKGFDLSIALSEIKKNLENSNAMRDSEVLQNVVESLDSIDSDKRFSGIKNELNKLTKYLLSKISENN